jgi:hypothetical protein
MAAILDFQLTKILLFQQFQIRLLSNKGQSEIIKKKILPFNDCV